MPLAGTSSCTPERYPLAVTLPADSRPPRVDNLDHALVERCLLSDGLSLDPGDKRITYVGGDYPAAWLCDEVDAGRAELAILIAPVTVDDFVAVNLARRKMPRKSTWFTPKARAGIVILRRPLRRSLIIGERDIPGRDQYRPGVKHALVCLRHGGGLGVAMFAVAALVWDRRKDWPTVFRPFGPIRCRRPGLIAACRRWSRWWRRRPRPAADPIRAAFPAPWDRAGLLSYRDCDDHWFLRWFLALLTG